MISVLSFPILQHCYASPLLCLSIFLSYLLYFLLSALSSTSHNFFLFCCFKNFMLYNISNHCLKTIPWRRRIQQAFMQKEAYSNFPYLLPSIPSTLFLYISDWCFQCWSTQPKNFRFPLVH